MEDSELIAKLREKLAAETDTLPSSQERVVIDVAQLEDWFIGTYGTGIDPESIALTSMDLAEFRTWLLRTCKPATVQRKLASIRSMLKLLAPTVLTSLRMPKLPPTPKPAPSGWTRSQRLAILRAVAKLGDSPLGRRDRALCAVALWTGARVSSIAALKLSNVKLGARSGSVTFDVVKGGRGCRTVTVPANVELREALAEWIRVRPPVKHDFLFTSEKYPYEGITRWTVHDVWHRRMAKYLPKELAAKIKGTHTARHALARLLVLEQGVPIADAAAILGNDPRTLVHTYNRPSEEDLRRHLERAVGEEPED